MSTRYAMAICVMLGIALVPTVIHSYLRSTEDDGRLTKAIDTEFGEYTSSHTRRRPEWVKDVYDSEDWIERIYTDRDGSEVKLFVARSYNLKRLYHHPELGVLYGKDLSRPTTVNTPVTGSVPVHVLRANTGKGVAVYALLYDEEFVADPISLQLRSALKQLVSARKPMTLFLAYDPKAAPDARLDQADVVRILGDAIHSFLSQIQKES